LAQKHEELQLNIDYLESTRAKNEKEMLALQRSPSQPKKATSFKDEDENAVQLQHDIAEHEATIGRLQRVLKNKDAKVCNVYGNLFDPYHAVLISSCLILCHTDQPAVRHCDGTIGTT
jgi:hypothetical protein